LAVVLANFFDFYIIFSDLSKYMPNFFFAKKKSAYIFDKSEKN